MWPKVSKDYLINEIRKREKFRNFVYRGNFPLNLKYIVFSVVSVSYRNVRSAGDFFICCKNAMNIRGPPSQTN